MHGKHIIYACIWWENQWGTHNIFKRLGGELIPKLIRYKF